MPSWNIPNNQDGFLSLDRSEAQNLDFTPSESIYPFKLKRLHSKSAARSFTQKTRF